MVALFTSCSKHPEPFFEDIYVYKNTLSNKVSIDFYRTNVGKLSIDIIDSTNINSDMIIDYNNNKYNSNFSPGSNDSIIIKFYDGKKIIFKPDSNASNWDLNAINYSIYKETYNIKGNLTTRFYTYTIDNKIYDLAE